MAKTVAIIGAGAAGLLAAISVKRSDRNINVIILEKNKQIGRKIAATGNGKCNLSNIHADGSQYNDYKFVSSILKRFGPKQTLDLFESIGIFYRIDNFGRVYPITESAISVVECLQLECLKLKIKIELDCAVTAILKNENKLKLKYGERSLLADSLIVAAGGVAYPKLGSDGSIYPALKKLGHTIVPHLPALGALKCQQNVKMLSGVKVKSSCFLIINNEVIAKEEGELLFKDDGLSGICIFQLSSYIARHKLKNKMSKYKIAVNLVPLIEKKKLTTILKSRNFDSNLLMGIVHPKLANYLLNSNDLNVIIDNLVNLTFDITGDYDFSNSQVSVGGLSLDEVDANSLMSKLVPNLYYAGEVLNVDGLSGGFNLQFAFSSGVIAGVTATARLNSN